MQTIRFVQLSLLVIMLTGMARANTLYVANYTSSEIDKINADGTLSVFASGFFPIALTADKTGNLYASDFGGNVYHIAADGSVSLFAALNSGFTRPMAFDSAGNLYATGLQGPIYKIAPDGMVSTFFTYADPNRGYIEGICFDQFDNLYVSNAGSTLGHGFLEIERITPDGSISFFANGTGPIAFDNSGYLYASSVFGGQPMEKIAPNGMISPFGPVVPWDSVPSGVSFDDSGRLYVSTGSRIYQVSEDGSISLLIGAPDSTRFGNLVFGPTTNAVPEPSSIVMLGLGAICLAGLGVRRRRMAR